MSRDFIGCAEFETRTPFTSEQIPSNILTDDQEAQLRIQTLDRCEKNDVFVCDVITSNSKNQKGPKMNYTEIYRKNFDSLSSINDEEYTDNE